MLAFIYKLFLLLMLRALSVEPGEHEKIIHNLSTFYLFCQCINC